MLNKNLALVVLVLFVAGCGTEVRTYVMTKPRVGLDRGNGNGGCVVGTCPPAATPVETTRKVYVLELTRPVPESEVQKIEETAVNAIATSAPTPSDSDQQAAQSAPPAANNAQAAPAVNVPVVGELPGTLTSSATSAPISTQQQPLVSEGNGGSMQAATYTVQKDDTLQKIAKKVYGTYKKWYRIYKANKGKISNPNVLKPGTVLDIPK